MKTPEEYYHSFKSLLTRTYRPTEISYQKYFVEILAEAQKEAYNQALFDLADDDLLPDKQKNLIKYMK